MESGRHRSMRTYSRSWCLPKEQGQASIGRSCRARICTPHGCQRDWKAVRRIRGRIRHGGSVDRTDRTNRGSFVGRHTRPEQVRYCDGCDDQNDRHDKQQLNEREAFLRSTHCCNSPFLGPGLWVPALVGLLTSPGMQLRTIAGNGTNVPDWYSLIGSDPWQFFLNRSSSTT